MKDRSWEIEVYRKPKRNVEYTIGGDPAGGMANSTWSVAHVLRSDTGMVVAVVRDKIDPDMYGKMVESLGYVYNEALVCVERNRDGQAINNFLMNRDYTNLFFDRQQKIRGQQVEAKPGLYTNKKKKMEIISTLQGAVHDDMITIPHKQTITEMRKFVKDEKGIGQAQEGFYDDCVMSLACAVYADSSYGYKRASSVDKPTKSQRKEVDTMANPHHAAFGGRYGDS
jgi:hypothetical protein